MASQVHSLRVTDITTDGLYKKDSHHNLALSNRSHSSRSMSPTARTPRSPWALELQNFRAERKSPTKSFDAAHPTSLDEIVDERVHNVVNDWIAEKHPPVNLNPLVKVDALKGSKKPKALWIGLQWELKPSVLSLNLRMLILAFCLDGSGKCVHPQDVIHLGNPKGRDDCIEHTAGGRKGDLETIRLNLYPLQVLGIKSLSIMCHLKSMQHMPQKLQSALSFIRCAIYDKFGSRYRTSCQLAVAGPILAHTTTMELLRIQQEGSTWMVSAPLKQHGGPLKVPFQDLRPVAQYRTLAKGEAFPLEGPIAADQLLLDFVCFSEMAGCGLDIVVAGLDSKGELAMPVVTSSGPALPGLAPGRMDSSKTFSTMEVNMPLLPATVTTLICIGCLNPLSVLRGYSFAQIIHSGVRLYVRHGDVEQSIVGHDLSTDLQRETAVEFWRFQRGANGRWKSLIATSEGMVVGRDELLQMLAAGQWLVKPDAIQIKTGDRINLSKAFPGLRTANVALQWDSPPGQKVDLNLLAVCLGSDEKLASSQDCVGGRRKKCKDGTVVQLKESTDGEGDGDDEVVQIKLTEIRSAVEHITLVVTVESSDSQTGEPHTFAHVPSASIRMYDVATSCDVFKFAINGLQFAKAKALEFSTLTRRADLAWMLTAKPEPRPGTVAEVLAHYHHNMVKKDTQQVFGDRCNRIQFGLGWDAPRGVPDIDLDVVAFGVTANGSLASEDYYVSFDHLTTADGAIRHSGDARSGTNKDDDETVEVQLKALPAALHELILYVTIYDEMGQPCTFGKMPAIYMRAVEMSGTKAELFRCDFSGDHGDASCLEIGRLQRTEQGKWAFFNATRATMDTLSDLYEKHSSTYLSPRNGLRRAH